jgi:uncharacterized protein
LVKVPIMKPSRFNMVVHVPHKRETVLFNSFNGALTVWPSDEYIHAAGFLSEERVVPATDNEHRIFQHLTEQGFLIPNYEDELKVVEERKRSGMSDQNRLDVIVMPNMFCNLRCPYCYERHQSGSFMTDDTERRLVAFLDRTVPQFKVLLLSWFGGEPLLSYRRVLRITRAAIRSCEQYGVEPIIHMTTNGYLLGGQKTSELIECGIHNYQITVDGPPAVHDRTRVLRDGSGTFSIIFRNIHDLVRADPRVRIAVRINFNHVNIEYIPELLHMFAADVRPALRIVFEPIFGATVMSATANICPDEISRRTAEYYELARDLGYDIVLGGIPVGQLVYCYAERENQYIFNYNGDVFKCSVGSFAAEDRFGSLNEAGQVVRETTRWNEWFNMDLFDAKCTACSVLPLCMGGCRKARAESHTTGTYCALVPTNACHTLKAIAFGSFENELVQLCKS